VLCCAVLCCAELCQIASLDPGTHAYSFWEGVPYSGKRAFGRLFRTSKTLKVGRWGTSKTLGAAICQQAMYTYLALDAWHVATAGSSVICWLPRV